LVLTRRARTAIVIFALFVIPFGAWIDRNLAAGTGVLSAGYESTFAEMYLPDSQPSGFMALVAARAPRALQFPTESIPGALLSVDLGGPGRPRSMMQLEEWLRMPWLGDLVGLPLTFGVIVGWLQQARRRIGLAEISTVLFLGALMFWGYGLQRLLLPVIPLLFLYLAAGGWSPVGPLPARRQVGRSARECTWR